MIVFSFSPEFKKVLKLKCLVSVQNLSLGNVTTGTLSSKISTSPSKHAQRILNVITIRYNFQFWNTVFASFLKRTYNKDKIIAFLFLFKETPIQQYLRILHCFWKLFQHSLLFDFPILQYST